MEKINMLPDGQVFEIWHEIIYFSSGINFSLDVVIAAYFYEVGYCWGSGMREYEFSLKKAVDRYRDSDGKWSDELSVDVIKTLLNACCLIQFNMSYPSDTDTPEYKKEFDVLTEAYKTNYEKLNNMGWDEYDGSNISK